MTFKIHRDVDTLRLRKVVVELYADDGSLLDRRRMFSFPLFSFAARLRWVKARMLRCGQIMLDGLK